MFNTNLIDFRLFCKPEDEQSTPSEGVIQARERGLRSSSETSVFDFRESDSDGETASERQSLHEMRKDRDRRLQEKHQNIPASSLDPTSDLVEVLRVINCCLSFNLSFGDIWRIASIIYFPPLLKDTVNNIYHHLFYCNILLIHILGLLYIALVKVHCIFISLYYLFLPMQYLALSEVNYTIPKAQISLLYIPKSIKKIMLYCGY